MYPRSSKFDTTVISSHRIKCVAEVCKEGTTEVLATLPITEGNISIDDVPVRREADLDLSDKWGEFVPEDASSMLAPHINEVRLKRGIVFPDGTEELIPQGVYIITDNHMDDSGPAVHMSLSLKDRGYDLGQKLFTTNTQIAAGTNAATAIDQLLDPVTPFYHPK